MTTYKETHFALEGALCEYVDLVASEAEDFPGEMNAALIWASKINALSSFYKVSGGEYGPAEGIVPEKLRNELGILLQTKAFYLEEDWFIDMLRDLTGLERMYPADAEPQASRKIVFERAYRARYELE